MTVTAPTREIGYVSDTWWTFDPGETTPELQWPLSVQVYDQMRKQDAQVGSVLEAVCRPVLRTPWRLDPAGARDEVTEFVANDLGLPIVGANPSPPPRGKNRFSWSEHLELALLMLPFGHIFFEQTYRITDDGTQAHLDKLSPRMPRTIAQVDVARDGGLVSITQFGTLDQRDPQKPIPVNRLVAYIYKREGANWLGRSILRQAYKNWLIKDRLLRVQAQTIERNGMGIPRYTNAQDATEQDKANGLAMAKAWRSGEAAGASIPFGAALDLVGVSGELPDALPAIKYHDEQIARAVLAHFLNLDNQSHGSYALGTSFMDFFTLSLQTLAQSIADVASMHIVEDLVDINFGTDEPAPKVVFDEIGSRQAATAAAIKTLIDAGVITPDDVLEESSRQQYGLPPADPETARDGGPKAPTPSGGTTPLSSPPSTPTGARSVAAAAEFNPSLHPRGAEGRFRTTLDRIVHGLRQWAQAGGKGDPFPGFDREQLRRFAVRQRGLKFPPRVSEEQIRDALLVNLRDELAGDKPEPAKVAKKAAKKAAPSASLMSQMTPEQRRIARQFGLPDNHPLLALVRRVEEAHSEEEIKSLLRNIHDDDVKQIGRELGVTFPTGQNAEDRKVHIAKSVMVFGHGPGSSQPVPAKKAVPKAPAKGPGGSEHRVQGRDLLHDPQTRQAVAAAVAGRLDEGPRGDEMLAGIAEAQKFDGKPRVVSPDEFDRIAADRPARRGELGMLYRGTRPDSGKSASQIHEQVLSGEYRGAAGIYGHGIHLSNERDYAADYATSGGADGVLGRYLLDPQAVGVDYRGISREHEAFLASLPPGSPEAIVYGEVGRYAAASGYDYIVATERPGDRKFPVVLNRTALIVDRKSYPAASRQTAPKAPDKPSETLDSLRKLDDPEKIRDALDLKTVPQLKEMLGQEGLGKSGRKRELVDRLVEHIKPSQKAEKTPDPFYQKVADDLKAGRIDPAEATRLLQEHGRRLTEEADKAAGRTEPGQVFRPLPLPPAKKATRPQRPSQKAVEDQANARLKKTQAVKAVSEVLAELDELQNSQASPKALEHRLRSTGRRGKVSPDLVDELVAAANTDNPDVRAVQVENRIRAAYVKHKIGGGYAPLADIRDELSDLPRAEQDKALTALAMQPGVHVIPWDNRKALTPRDHEAALRFGGDENHVIRFDDPSPRPLPSKKAASVVDRIAREHGLTRVSSAGAREPFDRKRHDPIGPQPEDGTPVVVLRPGYEAVVDGEKVQLSRPKVIADVAPPKKVGTGGPKPRELDTEDHRLLKDIDRVGFATAGITTTGRQRQRTDRLDTLVREGLLRKNRGGYYSLTDQGRAAVADAKVTKAETPGGVRLEPAPTAFGNVKEAHDVFVGDTNVGTVYVGNDGQITVFPPAGRQGRGGKVPQPPAGATVDEAAQILKKFHEAESSVSAVDRARRHVETLVPEYKGNRLLQESREPIIRVLGQQADVAPATTLSLDAVEYAPADARRDGMFGWGFGEQARYDQFSQGIRLSPDWHDHYSELSEASRHAHESGWHPPTTEAGGPAASMAHEFGHHVVKTIGFNGFDEQQSTELFGALERALDLDPGTLYEAGSGFDKADINNRLISHSDVIRERISGYAAQPSDTHSSQLDEVLAEVWQEYSMMGEQARPLAKEIGAIMARLSEQAAR